MTRELSSKRPDPEVTVEDNPQSKWAPMDHNKLSALQKRHMLARVCQVPVMNVFAHHQYQFDGQSYHQALGAHIGLRLTSIVTHIVMDEWMSMFLFKVTHAGMDILAITKYVNDLNVVMVLLSLGSRWEDGMVMYSQELEQDDRRRVRYRDIMTMKCLREEVPDSVLPWLCFILDAPELHDTGMVPVLDLHVWIRKPEESEGGLGSDLIAWMFYEKLTSAAS